MLSVLKNFEKVDPAKVTATAHFANDLGLDSLDAVEVRTAHMGAACAGTARARVAAYSAQQFRPPLPRRATPLTAPPPLALQVCMALEEEFAIAIPDAEAEKILSAEDAVAFVSTHPNAK